MSHPVSAPQSAARKALATQFAPALIYSYALGDGAIDTATDTAPCLHVRINADGALSSPLAGAPELREADVFDRARVDRAIAQMTRAVAACRDPWASVIAASS